MGIIQAKSKDPRHMSTSRLKEEGAERVLIKHGRSWKWKYQVPIYLKDRQRWNAVREEYKRRTGGYP